MPVAFVIDKFPPFIGGAEFQAELLARLVSGRLGESRVFTSQPGARSDAPGVSVRRLGRGRGHGVRHPVNFAAAFGHFLLHGQGYSIVHGYALSGLTCGAVLAARRRGSAALIKICAAGPDGDIAKLTRHPIGRRLWPAIRRVCAFVVPSPALIADLAAHGVPPANITVIPNALSPAMAGAPGRECTRGDLRRRLGLPDRPTVLFVGRLSPEKGPDLLMRAWEHIARESDATLVIVGAGSETPRMEEWARATHDPDRVRLFGARLDVDAFYTVADVLVVPSRTETFSNVMAEAMAHGVAVVTTPVGLATHWIRDGHSGLIVAGDDERHMARAVIDLLREPARRRALGRAAREQALATFTADVVVERYIEVYERLIDAARVAFTA